MFIDGEDDQALGEVVSWFRAHPDVERTFGRCIRRSFDEVFDGQRTGRYRLEQLSKVEKTYVGTKVEIIVQAAFGLHRGQHMDYEIAGHEVDAKWSMKLGGWMIPSEAVGHLCLCMTADDQRSTYSVGLVRASEAALKAGVNKDGKRYLSDAGLASMVWIVRDGDLPENLLLHMDPAVRDKILSGDLSGQGRVNELFRSASLRLVSREVVLTVAQQDDGPKRVRDARHHLRSEGVIVLGHQNDHPRIARLLGLDPPAKGNWVSVRLVPADADGIEIGGTRWRIAEADDPAHPGPAAY